jgi:signal transduction histidine kinase/CheY-like chemotaxis protein
VQKLVSLRSPRFKNNTSHMRRMNLAALVVPGIITVVCLMVGLLTLHEYCAAELAAGAPARCFLPVGSGDVIDSASNLEHLKFTKIAAISFYAGSLLTTAGAALAPGRSGGPLKLTLMLYHTLICLWSTVYYTLDFLDRVPLIRSERDGMIEYSAMRVLAVWPVTSTLMISKIAVLCMMTRHVVNEGAEEGADGGAEGADPDDGWQELGWARPFARLVDAMNLTSRISDRVDGDEVMSTSWDVWFVSLVNNLMLLAGAFGLVADNYWVRAASMATSCALFVIIMLGFRLLFAYVVARVRHPDDIIALRALEKMTYFTWTLFPLIQLLREFRYIDTATQFLLMTAADIVAKMSYSTNLIFSNFWLINAADGLMRLDEDLFSDALELSRCSQLAAQTLEKAKLEAESVSNLHRAFVANISHELRTPLNSIIAFNSLLMEDETLSEAQREFVASAIVSAEALLGIIGQILDFAKLESGSEVHQELVIESFDVNDVMNELVDIVGHQANKNQVELVLDIDPSLDGLVVRGDKFRLRQALINVTNNSIKYTREGGEVRIRVECLPQAPRRPRAATHAHASAWLTGSHADIPSMATTSTEPPSAVSPVADDRPDAAPRLWVRFEVVDTGIGIAEDKIGVIFMPFGQASISSTREYGGTGLGLAITSNIVRALGGVISCKSALGRGTSMTLEIPLAVPERPGETTAQPPIAHFAFRRAVFVVSVVANASLANAVGRVARGGGARHENLPAARTFPHTAYQRATWARELCGAIRRRWCGGDADVVLVVEEGFLAPMWAEWHASYGDERLPPVVAVVGKKTILRDARGAVPAGANANDGSLPRGLVRGALERARRISGSVRVSTASGGMFPFGVGGADRSWDRDSDSPASAAPAPHPPLPDDRDEDPAGMEAGWRALLRSIVQVVRPVKPSAMRAAMRRAEAMLERADAGGATDEAAFGGGRVGPADETRATNGTMHAMLHGGANGAEATRRHTRASRASVTEPNADEAFRHVRGDVRVTRSAARRASAAEISEMTAGGDALGGGNGILVDDAGTQPPRSRPRDTRVSAVTDGENRSYATAVDEPPFRHGGKVLIVEDNLMNQKVASVVVKHCGMTADLANNGKEAVEMLRAGARYDVVLMDVQMPVMDGLDATRAIRRMELSGEIRGRNFIVATSANATAENHQEGFAAGMDEYITKPIYPTRLKELLMLPKVREAEEVAAAAEGAEARTGEVTSAAAREREAPPSRRTGAATVPATGVVTRRRNAARNR